jgi:hypothetical protein
MVAELGLPRTQWETHPNYPNNVLLLGSHRNFRAMSRQLVAHARAGVSASSILNNFSWWKSAMRSHEHYEEAKLYPYLQHRWGLDCSPLVAGHEALSIADEAVRRARGGDLTAALEAHHATLMDHLDAEEDLVIPALLALPRAAFDDYSRRGLWWLLQEVPCHRDEGCEACR